VDTVARYLVEATKDEGIEFDLYDYIEKYGFYMVVFKKAAA
jgi:hypothetical protein